MNLFQLFELDAIARYTCLPNRTSVCSLQVSFVRNAHDVNRDAHVVRAYANLIKVACFAGRKFQVQETIANVGMSNRFSALILAI